MVLHPATRILVWVVLTVAVQSAAPSMVAVLVGVGLLILWRLQDSRLARLILRMRYVFLALIFIYAYATPGAPLVPRWGALSPTGDGLAAGALQILRLIAALTALRILLHDQDRNALLCGLVSLLRPLRLFHLDWKRIAVRVWLALEYADRLGRQSSRSLLEQLRSPDASDVEPGKEIRLPDLAASWRDAVAVLFASAFAGVLLR
jgi:energy-coupling factor transporter transmembrane protein EcfT